VGINTAAAVGWVVGLVDRSSFGIAVEVDETNVGAVVGIKEGCENGQNVGCFVTAALGSVEGLPDET
jgi:hypothetical protein